MSLTLKRLGLCVGAALLLVFYVSAATNFHLNFYLPIGLLLMSIYCWLVITRFKGVYPKSTTATGQLLLTFSLILLSSSFRATVMATRIKQEGAENPSSVAYSLVEPYAQISIASLMCLVLLITYMVLKIAKRK